MWAEYGENDRKVQKMKKLKNQFLFLGLSVLTCFQASLLEAWLFLNFCQVFLFYSLQSNKDNTRYLLLDNTGVLLPFLYILQLLNILREESQNSLWDPGISLGSLLGTDMLIFSNSLGKRSSRKCSWVNRQQHLSVAISIPQRLFYNSNSSSLSLYYFFKVLVATSIHMVYTDL